MKYPEKRVKEKGDDSTDVDTRKQLQTVEAGNKLHRRSQYAYILINTIS